MISKTSPRQERRKGEAAEVHRPHDRRLRQGLVMRSADSTLAANFVPNKVQKEASAKRRKVAKVHCPHDRRLRDTGWERLSS